MRLRIATESEALRAEPNTIPFTTAEFSSVVCRYLDISRGISRHLGRVY